MINNENTTDLKQAIVGTIAFFDLFNYPLTGREVWQYLPIKCVLDDVLLALEAKIAHIDSQNGFYFLSGRNQIIQTRMDRYNFTDEKFKRALWVVKILRFIPWINFVTVSNLIGQHNLRESSDIDLFIITESKRIWLTRFLCNSFAQIFGLRPSEKKQKNKICLSFFTSELSLKDFLLTDKKDWYFIYWLAGLNPIYDKNNTYERLIEANGWMTDALPNWQKQQMSFRRSASPFDSKIYFSIWEILFGWMESLVKKLQLYLMPANLKNEMNKSRNVVINDAVLKMHTNDRRDEYLKKYLEKLEILRI